VESVKIVQYVCGHMREIPVGQLPSEAPPCEVCYPEDCLSRGEVEEDEDEGYQIWEVWEVESGNLLAYYDNEEDAIGVMKAYYEDYPESAMSLFLIQPGKRPALDMETLLRNDWRT
jgi:hypothetical protein